MKKNNLYIILMVTILFCYTSKTGFAFDQPSKLNTVKEVVINDQSKSEEVHNFVIKTNVGGLFSYLLYKYYPLNIAFEIALGDHFSISPTVFYALGSPFDYYFGLGGDARWYLFPLTRLVGGYIGALSSYEILKQTDVISVNGISLGVSAGIQWKFVFWTTGLSLGYKYTFYTVSIDPLSEYFDAGKIILGATIGISF